MSPEGYGLSDFTGMFVSLDKHVQETLFIPVRKIKNHGSIKHPCLRDQHPVEVQLLNTQFGSLGFPILSSSLDFYLMLVSFVLFLCTSG